MPQTIIPKSSFQCTRFTHDSMCSHYDHTDDNCFGVPSNDSCGECVYIEMIRADQTEKCIALVEVARMDLKGEDA
jgi:hypothetical protein